MTHRTSTPSDWQVPPVLIVNGPADWPLLVSYEPALADLEAEALAAPSGDFSRDYSRLKRQLERLVGWHARRPELRSPRAYQIAVRHIAAALEMEA